MSCQGCNLQEVSEDAKVCKSTLAGGQLRQGSATATTCSMLAAVSSAAATVTPPTLLKSSSKVTINGASARALVDSCSTESFIHPCLAESLSLKRYSDPREISMAQSSLSAKTLGYCVTDIEMGGKTYSNFRLSILPGLCSDLILGLDFQEWHQSVNFPRASSCSLWPQYTKSGTSRSLC